MFRLILVLTLLMVTLSANSCHKEDTSQQPQPQQQDEKKDGS